MPYLQAYRELGGYWQGFIKDGENQYGPQLGRSLLNAAAKYWGTVMAATFGRRPIELYKVHSFMGGEDAGFQNEDPHVYMPIGDDIKVPLASVMLPEYQAAGWRYMRAGGPVAFKIADGKRVPKNYKKSPRDCTVFVRTLMPQDLSLCCPITATILCIYVNLFVRSKSPKKQPKQPKQTTKNLSLSGMNPLGFVAVPQDCDRSKNYLDIHMAKKKKVEDYAVQHCEELKWAMHMTTYGYTYRYTFMITCDAMNVPFAHLQRIMAHKNAVSQEDYINNKLAVHVDMEASDGLPPGRFVDCESNKPNSGLVMDLRESVESFRDVHKDMVKDMGVFVGNDVRMSVAFAKKAFGPEDVRILTQAFEKASSSSGGGGGGLKYDLLANVPSKAPIPAINADGFLRQDAQLAVFGASTPKHVSEAEREYIKLHCRIQHIPVAIADEQNSLQGTAMPILLLPIQLLASPTRPLLAEYATMIGFYNQVQMDRLKAVHMATPPEGFTCTLVSQAVAGRHSGERPEDAGDAMLLQGLREQEEKEEEAVAAGSQSEIDELRAQLASLTQKLARMGSPPAQQQQNNNNNNNSRKRKRALQVVMSALNQDRKRGKQRLAIRNKRRLRRKNVNPPAAAPQPQPQPPPMPPVPPVPKKTRGVQRVELEERLEIAADVKPGDNIVVEAGCNSGYAYYMFKATSVMRAAGPNLKCQTFPSTEFGEHEQVVLGHFYETDEDDSGRTLYYLDTGNRAVVKAPWVTHAGFKLQRARGCGEVFKQPMFVLGKRKHEDFVAMSESIEQEEEE